MPTLPDEIATLEQHCRALIAEYVEVGGQLKHGRVHSMLYDDVLDFVNFRMETATSCLDLIKQGSVADALGLCRALLESYLLLILMCRGTKFFQLRSCENMTEAQFKTFAATQASELESLRASGKSDCIAVKRYPRAKRHLMYVYEGLRDRDDPSVHIPLHYFRFREFDPTTMRLDPEEYFTYYPTPDQVRKSQKSHRDEVKATHRFYLSYDAMLQCLELNGIANRQDITRIEAHYTFLGRFLHPTHDAARDLHIGSNIHSGSTTVGLDSPYAPTAVLMALLYVSYALTGILNEVATWLESAPADSIADPGTRALRARTKLTPTRFPYFWFIFNEAPAWDRFNYAIHHCTDTELEEYGGYQGVPTSKVTFDMHIYGRLKSALNSWSNTRVGRYVAPVE